MQWSREKLYIIVLFAILMMAIIATLYFNRKTGEGYEIQNRRIYILYTSGNIGMVKNSQGYKQKHGFLESKLQEIVKKVNHIAPYDVNEYKPLLNSSNMTPTDWVRIAKDITRVYNKYDAFIIIHGTETMAYTASALSFMMENLNKPVIITGSDKNLQDHNVNGKNNLLTSMLLATKYKIPEVLICFSNKIIRGCRSTKNNSGIISPVYPLLGRANNNISINDQFILDKPRESFKLMPINPLNKVVVVKLFPGIDSNFLNGVTKGSTKGSTKGNIQGIILESYTITYSLTKKSFINAIRELIKRGVIIVNVSQSITRMDEKKSDINTELERVGVLNGMDMTTEAALAKIYFLISNIKKPKHNLLAKLIKTNMRGECK